MEGIVEFKTQSETIGKIAAALVAFQGQSKGVKKTAENPFFHSKYAELSDVWDEIREPLTKNGLAVVQTFLGDSLVTTLAHTSGEWFRGYLKLTPAKANDPQAQGSAITYVRRYALQAITGIAPIDDDGNAASRPEEARRPQIPQTAQTPVKSNPPANGGVSDATPEPAELYTSSFEVSEPIASKNKKGSFYRKALDSEGSTFYIFDDHVIQDLSVAGSKRVTVELKKDGNWTRIIGVIPQAAA